MVQREPGRAQDPMSPHMVTDLKEALRDLFRAFLEQTLFQNPKTRKSPHPGLYSMDHIGPTWQVPVHPDRSTVGHLGPVSVSLLGTACRLLEAHNSMWLLTLTLVEGLWCPITPQQLLARHAQAPNSCSPVLAAKSMLSGTLHSQPAPPSLQH